jgi:hypothetical protein
VAQLPDLAEDAPDFITGQHDGQFVFGARAGNVHGGPVFLQRRLEEKLDAAERNRGGGSCEAFLVLEIKEIRP